VADGSADELARRVAGKAQVKWSCDGEQFVHATSDATGFVRNLFAQYGQRIADLEVRRPSLEDTYITMVRQFESGGADKVVVPFDLASSEPPGKELSG
jgi:ABC-2 type transport system ATP-binding protein